LGAYGTARPSGIGPSTVLALVDLFTSSVTAFPGGGTVCGDKHDQNDIALIGNGRAEVERR
jgi:hypothetical protein